MWWFVLRALTADDLAFLDGCWERMDHGVERVRWTRDGERWTGRYEQDGPKNMRVRASLTITSTGGGLRVVTTNEECRWDTCLAPFRVDGVFTRRDEGLVVLGTEDSALWLGFDRGRLLFGQAEANAFTPCVD